MVGAPMGPTPKIRKIREDMYVENTRQTPTLFYSSKDNFVGISKFASSTIPIIRFFYKLRPLCQKGWMNDWNKMTK